MKRLIVAAAVLLLSGGAQAQTPAPPPVAAAQPSPTKLALARRFVEVVRLRKSMEIMMKDLGPVIREQEKAETACLSPEQRRLLYESIDETIAMMFDRMVEEMERQLSINEDVLRYLTIRVDELDLELSPVLARRDRERERDRPRDDYSA